MKSLELSEIRASVICHACIYPTAAAAGPGAVSVCTIWPTRSSRATAVGIYCKSCDTWHNRSNI